MNQIKKILRHKAFFAFCGIPMSIPFFLMGQENPLGWNIPYFLVLYVISFLAYLLALYSTWNRELEKKEILYLFLIALLCQVFLLFQEASLSTDIYRYLWDGHILNQGINPYLEPPNSPKLARFDTSYSYLINHPYLRTIYPPLSQMAFGGVAFFSSSQWGMKVFFIFFSMATLTLLLLFLKLKSLPLQRCLIYGWNPLVLLEFGHSGHLDSLAIFFMVLGLYLWEKGKTMQGAAGLSLSCSAKLFTFQALPWWIAKKRRKEILLFLGILFLTYLPFAGAGKYLFTTLFAYGKRWVFNSPTFSIAIYFLGHDQLYRLFLLILFFAFCIYQGIKQDGLMEYFYTILAFALIFNHTLLPWYFIWIIPFLCFYPNRGWILLTGTLALSYWVVGVYLHTGDWVLSPYIMALEYTIPYSLMIWDWWKGRRKEGL
ncbi:MAG: hypothetical protein D6785_00170 [Planctomycetota bacterium]|nr:MAG: hypothetical protein D6785_00170 [Planctomycetota bacterium]